jgi:putative endonuclease
MRNGERDSQRKGEENPKLQQKFNSNRPESRPESRMDRQHLARLGEANAAMFLKKAGYKIRETNWRAGRFSEIDIIAIEPEGNLVFVEVKTRYVDRTDERRGFFNAGFENIDWRKRQKLITTAQMYLSSYAASFDSCRFDAIVVYYLKRDQAGQPDDQGKHPPVPQIRHVKNIFE